MKKKLLSLILVLCMILSTAVTLGVTTFATGEGEPAATVTEDDFAKAVDAENPENNVIELQNKTDLKLFWQNYGNVKAGITVKLCADIAFNEGMNAMELTSTSDVSGLEVTTTTNAEFRGNFDGLKKAATDTEPAECYTISGLCLKDAQFVGHLYGTVSNVNFENCFQNNTNGESGIVAYYVRNGAKVTNVTMTDCHVMATGTGTIYVGGIAGRLASATISYCSFDGKTEYYIPSGASATTAYVGGFFGSATGASTIQYSTNRAEVVGWSEAGGFVSNVNATSLSIENCVNEGTVRNTGTNKTSGSVGGFVGHGYGTPSVTIRNCVNEGAVTSTNANMVGGFIGGNINTITIDNTVNLGTVTYYPGALNQVRVGGIVGSLPAGSAAITSCANFGDIDMGQFSSGVLSMAGGLIGHSVNQVAKVQNCLSAGDVYGRGYAGGLVGYAEKENATQGVYENILITGTLSIVRTGAGTHNFWGYKFGGGSIKGIYYIADALQHKAEADADWTIFDGTNAFYTALDSADALKGVAGYNTLTAAGYDFDTVWSMTNDLPVPTKLAKATPDATLDICYKGYQMGINEDAGKIRFIAGMNEIDGYTATGFDIVITTAEGSFGPTKPLTATTVYESLKADGNADAIKASDLGCSYLSALTLTDMPTDCVITLTATLTPAEGEVVSGTTVVIVVQNGAVVAQYVA